MRPRVAICDGHPMYASGLERVLSQSGRFEIVATGRTAAEAVRIAYERAPDIFLLGRNMPGWAITTPDEITAGAPAVRIVIVTSEQDQGASSTAHISIDKSIESADLIRLVEMIAVRPAAVSLAAADV